MCSDLFYFRMFFAIPFGCCMTFYSMVNVGYFSVRWMFSIDICYSRRTMHADKISYFDAFDSFAVSTAMNVHGLIEVYWLQLAEHLV